MRRPRRSSQRLRYGEPKHGPALGRGFGWGEDRAGRPSRIKTTRFLNASDRCVVPTKIRGAVISCAARTVRRLCVQATALHQASPVRRLTISKPLPFVCTAGVSVRWVPLPRGRRSSPRFAGIFQTASRLPPTCDPETWPYAPPRRWPMSLLGT